MCLQVKPAINSILPALPAALQRNVSVQHLSSIMPSFQTYESSGPNLKYAGVSPATQA